MNYKEHFPPEILPVNYLQILTLNADYTVSNRVWAVTPEFAREIMETFGEPHAESLIDPEHLQAGLDVALPGMSVMFQEG